ncbi:response regulator [Anoxynatronum buryatiense]|uniref:Stage 0 sporulation protein A homolog n=1 Tax=Anoxynatronum buryatiense TaxID=489973 RepID=A0AA45WWA7_9CLOT|nr:response regulator [Anoxynatronum buryatiense]SMP58602.1 His Kinase A (phospho-acceptor) domain-containing protein [Anoxynatronum buryatiense]
MRILVVDDAPLNLHFVTSILHQTYPQYEIYQCQRPRQVEKLVNEKEIDVLLLDITMPEISGLDLLKSLREKLSSDDLQIIMLTALDDDDIFQTCYALGANDYVKKPFNKVELTSRLNHAIKSIQDQQQRKQLIHGIKEHNNELRRVNMELQMAQAALVHSEKMAAIGQLAAGVAHEINNPIGYVSSNLETLNSYLQKMTHYIHQCREVQEALEKSEHIPSEALAVQLADSYETQKLGIIMEDLEGLMADTQEGVQRVATIVKTMRNFARSGDHDEKGWVILNDLIHQSMMMLQNESKYVADVIFREQDEIEVFCNQGQIGQVLVNILNNAIQAIRNQEKPERGRITIGLGRTEDKANIIISDNGPGIPREYLSRIFDPFFTSKKVGDGTGLGLSISYDIIVNKHGGMLAAHSETGRGAIFDILLPIHDYQESEEKE